MKHLRFSRILSSLSLVLLFWACEPSEELELLENQEISLDRELVSSNTDPKLKSLVDTFFPSSSSGRIENEFGLLNTEEVSKISNDSFTKYAALFETNDPYVFTNLILEQTADSSTAYIIQYLPDHDWYDSVGYDHAKWNYFNGDVYYYDLDGMAMSYSCMVDGVTDESCSTQVDGGRVEDVVTTCYTYIWITLVCSDPGGCYNSVEIRQSCHTVVDVTGNGSHDIDEYKHPDSRNCSYDSNYDCNPVGNSTPTRVPSCGEGFVYDSKMRGCVEIKLDVDIQGYDNLNDCEKKLVKRYPGAALKLNTNMSIAHEKTQQLFGVYQAGNGHNDCGDAFRHAYFNALNTKSIGADLAKEFGDAHECGTPRNQLQEKTMDLHNNLVGRNVAIQAKGASNDALAQLVLVEMQSGNMLILNNLDQYNNLTSRSRLASSSSCP